jgi:AraC family transcriptional regulator
MPAAHARGRRREIELFRPALPPRAPGYRVLPARNGRVGKSSLLDLLADMATTPVRVDGRDMPHRYDTNVDPVVFHAENFGARPYAGFGMGRYVRRTRSSWENPGWRSLVVQRFVHVPTAENVQLPTADVHLILGEAGQAEVDARLGGGRRSRYDLVPGRLLMNVPDQSVSCSYRTVQPLRTVQMHIPQGTVERTAEQLSGRAVDYERMAVSLEAGDPFLAQFIRTVDAAARDEAGDLYAESAAAFLAAHLLTRHSGHPARPIHPVREDARVRAAVALMRDRFAEPLTLADIANEVYLSVFHLLRLFKETTGETPRRFLTRIRIEEARRLLRNTELSVAEIAPRCGFASPSALSTAFLRHTGMRPSTYRNLSS